MKIKFWGVRGSLPSSLDPQAWVQHFKGLMTRFFDSGNQKKENIDTFLRAQSVASVGGYGTATTCVQITAGTQSLIIDGGSGIRSLSDALVKNAPTADAEFHILMTHYHFDHILGLPFFAPHFSKGAKINYYIVQSEGENLIREMFKRPVFPVGFEQLQAQISFHKINPYEKMQINGFAVTAFQMDHPDPCFGYRVEHSGKVYAHAVDNEATRVTREDLGRDGGLFEKANLMFFDAQYDEAEMKKKKGWGHGTCDRGFEVARAFGVQQILFAHHDPSFSIADLGRQKEKAEHSFEEKFGGIQVKWDFAVEGQTVEL